MTGLRPYRPIPEGTHPRNEFAGALPYASPASGGVTGDVHIVDAGYNIMLQPRPEDLNATE